MSVSDIQGLIKINCNFLNIKFNLIQSNTEKKDMNWLIKSLISYSILKIA